MCRTANRLIASGVVLLALTPSARTEEKAVKAVTQAGAGEAANVPLGTEPAWRPAARYRFRGGRWWFFSRDNRWFYWQDSRWIAYSPARAPKLQEFDRRFATYRDYQVGQRRLQTAEGGNAELATDDITEPGEAAEPLEVGGIPRHLEERRHTGIRRPAEEQVSDWFNAGSPFGLRYGYGSGFGYGGYGYNNPYGYGPRTGSGGGFAYGFGPYGSVGGQTGSQMGGGPSLISAEPSSLGAPGGLEKGPVGGSVIGASRRKLGGSASSTSGRD